MSIVRYFREDNAGDSWFAGVPARDLTQEDYDALPAHLQASVDESPLYQKSRPHTSARKTPAKADSEPTPVEVDPPTQAGEA